jgi:glycine cleavage system H protein
MSAIFYSKEHAWVRLASDGVATVGISDFAQDQLGELVFVELPQLGALVTASEPAASFESNKAMDDLIAPVSGEVVEVNHELDQDPDIVNDDPIGAGWVFKVRLSNESELQNLLSSDSYIEYIEG